MALHPPMVWEQFFDDVYSILKRTHLENFFHHINNLHQNIKFTMGEESNEEPTFLDTLLKRNNGILLYYILYWYIGSLCILTITYTTALTTKRVTRKVFFPPFLIDHIPLS